MKCPRSILAAPLAATLVVYGATEPSDSFVIFMDDSPAGPGNVLELKARLAAKLPSSRAVPRIELFTVDLSDKGRAREALAPELRRHPLAIVAGNSNAAMVAQSLTRDIPVVFGAHDDPVAIGLVKSLARPGGNLTGMTFYVPVDAKRLELLRELAPRPRKLGILIDRWWLDEGGGREVVRVARERFGFEAEVFLAETREELDRELATPRARSVEAWYVPFNWLAYAQPEYVVKAVGAMRRPAVYAATRFVEKGGLASYGQVIPRRELMDYLANPLALVLQGVPAGEIPVERPKAFELGVNLEAARALGLAIPAALLKRADRVVGQ